MRLFVEEVEVGVPQAHNVEVIQRFQPVDTPIALWILQPPHL